MRPAERVLIGTCAGAARRLLALTLIAFIILPAPQAVLAAVRRQHVAGVSNGKAMSDVSKLRVTGASDDEVARIRKAVGAIRYPLNTAVFRIDVYDESDADMQDAAAYYEFPASIIHLRRESFSGRPDSMLARLLAHELGHMVDMLYLTDQDRADVGKIRAYRMDMPWDDRAVPWGKRPSEDFAETFAQLTQPLSLDPVATDYGPVVQEDDLRTILSRHVTDRTETLQSIRTERFLNQLTNQFRVATDVPLAGFVMQVIVILYALTGALKGFREARVAVLREQSMRRTRTATAAGTVPGAASGHHA